MTFKNPMLNNEHTIQSKNPYFKWGLNKKTSKKEIK